MLQWNVSLLYQMFSGLIFLLHSCVCVIFLLQTFQTSLTSNRVASRSASSRLVCSVPLLKLCLKMAAWALCDFFFFVWYIKVIYTKWKTSGSLCGRTLSRVSVCSAAQTLSSSFWKPLSRFRMLCNTSRIWGRIWTYVILRSIELLLHDAAECICALLTHPPVAFCLQSVTFPGGLFPPLRMRCV